MQWCSWARHSGACAATRALSGLHNFICLLTLHFWGVGVLSTAFLCYTVKLWRILVCAYPWFWRWRGSSRCSVLYKAPNTPLFKRFVPAVGTVPHHRRFDYTSSLSPEEIWTDIHLPLQLFILLPLFMWEKERWGRLGWEWLRSLRDLFSIVALSRGLWLCLLRGAHNTAFSNCPWPLTAKELSLQLLSLQAFKLL